MITTTPVFDALKNAKAKSPYGYALVQMPTSDGAKVDAQYMLPNILSYRITRNEDPSSDTCELSFADDLATMFSPNPYSKLGALFAPGVIDTKFLVYLGYRGSTGQSGTTNLCPNADSLAGFTIKGATQASGGPGGASDLEAYSVTGAPLDSNAFASQVISVSPGTTYTPSWWIDPSQLKNNAGSMPNVLTEFAGSTQNADGSYTNVSGRTSKTAYTFTTGQCLTVSADLADSPAGSSQIQIGSSSNNYRVTDQGDGNFVIYKTVNNITQGVFSSHGAGVAESGYPTGSADWSDTADTQYHRVSITIIAGSPNTIIATWDDNVVTSYDGSLNLTSGTWPVALFTNSGSGTVKNYAVNSQVFLGIKTADGLQYITNQPVAVNTTTAGRYSIPAWTCPTNIVPHSDDLSNTAWSIGSPFTLANDGPNGAKSFTALGTGAAFSNQEINYRGIPCIANTQYTFSVWMDPSKISNGSVVLRIWDSTGATLLGSTPVGVGSPGRFSVTANSGSFTSLLVDVTLGGSTVQNGQKLIVSQPMVEQSSTASGYYISSQTPQVQLCAVGLASAWVNTGNLIAHSDTLTTGWTKTGGAVSNGGPNNAADFEVSSTAFASVTQNVPITAGLPYILSAWVDASQAASIGTGGYIYVSAKDVAGNPVKNVSVVAGASAGRFSEPYFVCPMNLALNSDSLSGWSVNANMVIGTGGPNGAADFEYTGTGSAITSNLAFWSANIPVSAGATFVPSMWVDFSKVTQGQPDMIIQDVDGNTINDSTWGLTAGAAPGRFAGPAIAIPWNYAPRSDDFIGWTLTGCALGNSGPNSAKSIEVTGTGSAQTFDAPSSNFTVTPGTQMTASVWVNSTDTFTYTGEQPRMILYDVTHGNEAADVYFTSGMNGRYSVTFTVPAGCTTMRIQPHCAGNGLTIPSGKKLKISHPALYAGNTATWYMSSTAPAIRFQPLMWSGATFIVQSGQKLKFSQPMLEQASAASGYYMSSSNPTVSVIMQAYNVNVNSGQVVKFSQPMLEQATVASTTYTNGQNKLKFSQPMWEVGTKATPYYVPPGPSTPNFVLNNAATLLQFTGYVQTDTNAHTPFLLDKSVSLIDLTSQFKFNVNDTFPHPLYGDQNLAYFDPTYNLTNPSGDGKTWVCDGKMFTLDSTSKIYGSTHIDPQVYVDTTGGQSPTSTAVANTGWAVNGTVGTCNNYTFDYNNGTVTFTSAGLTALGYANGLPADSVVSVAGNPTYMAPEVMIRKLFVEKASWSPNFIDVQTTNVLLPQFNADGKTLWDCVKLIADMTNPRFTNWVVWADENGMIRFYESKIDSPPVKSFIHGKNLFNATYEHDSKQLRTVVRADGETSNSDGTQAVAAIVYDVRAVNKYGLTEPLTLSTDVTSGVRHLGPTEATSELTMLCASALKQVSRPTLSMNAEINPDYSLQISDKVWVYDTRLGMDREYSVKSMTVQGDPTHAQQSVQLQEFYDTINFSLGIGNAVVAEGNFSSASQAPPSANLIGAVRLGSGAGTYVYRNGDYVPNIVTGDPIMAYWTPSDGTAMHFDFYLNSADGNLSAQTTTSQPWSYTNLPPGYGWSASTAPGTGDTVYYGTVPAGAPYGGTAGYTCYVGPDGIFYQFNHAAPIGPNDLNSKWVPTGNTADTANGGTQSYTGTASNAYVWTWFYLCLDSNKGVGPLYRPVMRVTPQLETVAQAVPATGGLWITQNWSAPPGPVFNTGTFASLASSLGALFGGSGGVTKYYNNVVVNVHDTVTPPPGFSGANVMGDGVKIGVAWGADAPNDVQYVNYRKRTRGHYCIFVCNDQGQRQFLRIPFWLVL